MAALLAQKAVYEKIVIGWRPDWIFSSTVSCQEQRQKKANGLIVTLA
jgi:hypothetical protein